MAEVGYGHAYGVPPVGESVTYSLLTCRNAGQPWTVATSMNDVQDCGDDDHHP